MCPAGSTGPAPAPSDADNGTPASADVRNDADAKANDDGLAVGLGIAGGFVFFAGAGGFAYYAYWSREEDSHGTSKVRPEN